MQKINIQQKLDLFSDHWSPRIIAELNGQHVKVAKLLGEFDWHHHAEEDELFWVIRGHLEIEFRDQTVKLGPGEILVVPKGVEHRPVAREECEIVLFEPAGTRNTGNLESERTVRQPRKI